jgi:hypothetical protein
LREHLLVSNTGPKSDGYTYCISCGRIEATSEPSGLLFAAHRKPYPDEKEPNCDNPRTTNHVVLGTDYITDVALFSMDVADPLRLMPGHFPTDVALRTVSEALAKAGCKMLDIEPGELMAEFRPSLTPEGRDGRRAEIFLYDTLPGGAGFSSQLVHRGRELFSLALEIAKTCPEGCDASCYRCLRSFKNKFEHTLLDRHVAAELLGYLITGKIPEFNAARIASSTELLAKDLQRQGGKITYELNAKVTVAGLGTIEIPILATRPDGRAFAIALASPLSSTHPADVRLLQLKDAKGAPTLVVVNDLLVRGNLPTATREALDLMML